MGVRHEKVDPDGDLLIILQPATDFAPWDALETPANQTRKRPRTEEAEEELRVLVSSTYLMNASRRFRTMLTGNWLEAAVVHPDGLRHVEMEGFDIDAFLDVMHIIHLKNFKVPQTVDLEKLAKIAVIVDDFNCVEAILPWKDKWIAQWYHWDTSLQTFGRDLILWILITSVLQIPGHFTVATKGAIISAAGPVPTLGLPIRKAVIDKINSARESHLLKLLNFFHAQLDKLYAGPPACGSNICKALLYGTLHMRMREASPALMPRPETPYHGYTIAGILGYATKNMKTPTCHGTHGSGNLETETCNLQDIMKRNDLFLSYDMMRKSGRDPSCHFNYRLEGLKLEKVIRPTTRGRV